MESTDDWLRSNTLNKYPGSIGSQYVRSSHRGQDYDALAAIVRARESTPENTPRRNTVVIHLRVGDVFEWNMAHDPCCSTDRWSVQQVLDGTLSGNQHFLDEVRNLPITCQPS